MTPGSGVVLSPVHILFFQRTAYNCAETPHLSSHSAYCRLLLHTTWLPGRVETPAEDVQIMATLLGVSPGTLGESAVAFPKGGGTCSNCSCAFTFIDITETGLKAHSKELLVDVMTGKHGYIVNPGTQPFKAPFLCLTSAIFPSRFRRMSTPQHFSVF
ncbi:hypothetical protein FB451DRAFT_771906 [Mycena latifolia]|nr:hypothetical protein FB451DRAFT_771906 [Mycena latifolia]